MYDTNRVRAESAHSFIVLGRVDVCVCVFIDDGIG